MALTIEEIQDFAEWEAKRRQEFLEKSSQEILTIEAEDLTNQIKKLNSNLLNRPTDQISEIILTTAIIAKRLKLDLIDILENKIEIIRSRKY